MKKHRFLRVIPTLAAVLAALTVAVLAAGDQGDPLVTLSYLNETYTKTLLDKADETLQKRNQELLEGLQGSGASAVYQVVTLKKGQTLWGEVGTEVMLRIGSAMCYAESAPGLVDTSTGTTINGGAALTTNHLYLMTIEGRGVQALSDTVKVMVRGPYTIS